MPDLPTRSTASGDCAGLESVLAQPVSLPERKLLPFDLCYGVIPDGLLRFGLHAALP